jgi:hypothetical protein
MFIPKNSLEFVAKISEIALLHENNAGKVVY